MFLHSKKILHFYTSLRPPSVPKGVEVLFPMQEPNVKEIMNKFFDKFYSDNNPRTLLLGINPGRFGAGVTGINFTAPKQLTGFCGIDHPFKMQSELSAEFIYAVINAFGGAKDFYSKFFVSAVSPLGYVKNGKNMNYYDDPALQSSLRPFIIDCIQQQYDWNINHHTCLCIGGEKNFKFLSSLNQEYQWFKQIIPLPHPRFIMQYKRPRTAEFVSLYLRELAAAANYKL